MGACHGPRAFGTRAASHAGSWYAVDEDELRHDLARYLHTAAQSGAPAKALIAPHAGYAHSGRTAAHAYARLKPEGIRRIVVLGPSHKVALETCALPPFATSSYATPLGDIDLDVEAIQDLRDTGQFTDLTTAQDEAEHSIEMQLPFLAMQMGGVQGWTILPLLVGRLNASTRQQVAELLTPLFDAPDSCFIISSDFCHWGDKFRYRHYRDPRAAGLAAAPARAINAGIELLDRAALELIMRQDVDAFHKYLQEEGNTICGRHAILLMLELTCTRDNNYTCTKAVEEIMRRCSTLCEIRFLDYRQSALLPPDPGPRDFSVSYAAGVCVRVG